MVVSKKTSSGEEGYTLPIKQESSDEKYEPKIKESSSETGEKTDCKDSVPDESHTHTFVNKTDRRANQDETNQDKSAIVIRTISQSGRDDYAEEIRKDGLGVSAQEEKPLVKDEGLAVKSSQRTKASKSEDGINSSQKQDSSQEQIETQSKDISAEMETEEMVYNDSVQHKSGLRRSFRQTARQANQDKTNENKAATAGKLTGSNSLVGRKEDRTPTRRRKTPARDPQQQNKEKTKNIPLMICNSRETQEEKKEAATPRRRGRPKKKVPVRTPTTELKLIPDGQTLERLQHKQKMDLSGPEPKRSCSQFAPVAAGVRRPPY